MRYFKRHVYCANYDAVLLAQMIIPHQFQQNKGGERCAYLESGLFLLKC